MNISTTQNNTEFDKASYSYDADFTFSSIGKAQRSRVYHWLGKLNFFDSAKSVLEINCGTGVDANTFQEKGMRVVATDASPGMIKVANQYEKEGLTFCVKDFDSVVEEGLVKNHAVLFSNFGGLNCLAPQALNSFLNQVGKQQKKHDLIALIIMPKKCMIENLYFFLKGEFNKINRRSREYLNVDVNGESVRTFYYSSNDIVKMLPNYSIKLIRPVAYFIPPSYLEPFFKKHPNFLSLLMKLEKAFGNIAKLADWSDHFIIIAEKE